MTPKEYIQSIQHKTFHFEDGEAYKLDFEPPLSQKEIDEFKSKHNINSEIEDLLRFTSGFTFFAGVDELKLKGIEDFGYDGIFKNPLVLAGDGAGNFWVVDTESKESWNRVYFICHDPNAWIIFANSFTEFLKNVIECKGIGKDDKVYEKCFEAYKSQKLFQCGSFESKNDKILSEFVKDLDTTFWIADLRKAKVGDGFSLRKVVPRMNFGKIIRHESGNLWAFEKIKKSFWWKFW